MVIVNNLEKHNTRRKIKPNYLPPVTCKCCFEKYFLFKDILK